MPRASPRIPAIFRRCTSGNLPTHVVGNAAGRLADDEQAVDDSLVGAIVGEKRRAVHPDVNRNTFSPAIPMSAR